MNSSASSAEDVAEAMEQVSASAGTFGISIEWLGSYIATIVDKTQQDASSVGRGLNTIISRLHSIKSAGYNSEDETTVNDVAKALATVDIALLDNEGNWRDMETIFEELAGKWDTMTDKQRSYIATTMAGTRQQNYFLTLMNDMAKGAEGGSKAYELYYGAMASAGTTAEAYTTYLDSVTAAQDKLTASLERVYTLFKADYLKSFYNAMSGIVGSFADVTENTNGANIAIAALTVTLGVAAVAVGKIKTKIEAGLSLTSKIGLIITAIGLVA